MTIGHPLLSRQRLRLIPQSEAAECGLACLAMIANYFGNGIRLSQLRLEHRVSMRGSNLKQLVGIAHQMGLECRPLRLSLDELSDLQLPAILHWKFRHFVVLKSFKGDKLTIFDPARGVSVMSLDQVSANFTGIAMEVFPGMEFSPREQVSEFNWHTIWRSLVGFRLPLLKIFGLSCLLQALVLIGPLYMQLIVDQVLVSQDIAFLNVIGLGFLLMMGLELVTSAIRSLLIIDLGSQFGLQFSSQLFGQLMRLPLEWFQRRHKADILSRFGSIEPVKQFFTTSFVEGIMDAMIVIITLVILYLYQSLLAWIVVLALLMYVLVRHLSFQSLRDRQLEIIHLKAIENSFFIESVQAERTLKLFNHQASRQQHWFQRVSDTLNATIGLAHQSVLFRTINSLLMGLENILVIYLAARMVMTGDLSLGMLFAFVTYKRHFTGRAYQLVEKWLQWRMLSLHMDRIADIALVEPESSGRITCDDSLQDLVIDNLCYRYESEQPWLIDHFCAHIKAGEVVAITGPSGAGKTTLINLIAGLLLPEKGQIIYGGTDIRHLDRTDYRGRLAVVSQNDVCLAGTIAENICFFDDQPDRQRIVDCAKQVNLHDTIQSMPMGYHSLISDMGAGLSGGQLQRLFIARALYRQPDILLLDEATAFLDSENEHQINDNIRKMHMTRIIIAHRPSTIAMADRVIDM